MREQPQSDDAEAPFGWRITPMGCLYVSAIFIVLTLIALPLDLLLTDWIREDRIRGDLERVIMLSEVFSHGLGVVLVIITAAVLDPRGWRITLRLLLCSLGAGGVADLCKVLFVARWRPNATFQPDGVRDSFVQWLPWLDREKLPAPWTRDLMSFPSAHTATAVGLALSFSVLYPRGTIWFCILACFSAFQRIESRAHYLSDTFAGAAIGCLFVALLLHSRWLETRLRKLEAGVATE